MREFYKKVYFEFVILVISIFAYFGLKDKALGFLIILNIILVIKFLYGKFNKDLFCIQSLFLIHYIMYVLHIPLKLLNSKYMGEAFYELSGDRFLATKVILVAGIIVIIALHVGCEIGKKIQFLNLIKLESDNCVYLKFKNIYNQIRRLCIKRKKYINVKNFYRFWILAGITFFLIGILKQGGLKYLLSVYIWNSDNIIEIGIMTTGLQIAFVGIIISFYEFVNRSDFELKKIIFWKEGYIYLLIVIIKFVQGGRIQVLMSAISLVSIYYYCYKKITFKKFMLLFLLGLISLGYIGYFRDYKTLIPSDWKTMVHYMLGGSGNLEYFLNSYTIFTTLSVISTTNIGYLFGATLLDGVIFCVPRIMLPNKEALLFTNQKLVELNKIEVISPVGGLNLAAQNMLNGYIVFTVIFMIIIGILLYKLNVFKNKYRNGKLIFSMILPYLIISFIRNPMFYTIKEILQFVLIPCLFYYFLRKWENEEKNNF
ncbi:MAG: O-antigen polymerase [Sarcina sp.]